MSPNDEPAVHPPGKWHCGHWRAGGWPCCGCGEPAQELNAPDAGSTGCPGGKPYRVYTDTKSQFAE